MDYKNLLNFLSAIVLVAAIPFYTYLVLSPNINSAVSNIYEISGIDISNSIIINKNSDIGTPFLNAIYFDSYQFFYLLTFSIGSLGVLIMYRGRSLTELILLFLFLVIPKQRKYWGIIYDKSTNKPLSLSVIRLYSIEDKNQLVAQQVSDLDGKYRLDLPKLNGSKRFLLTINAKGFVDYRKEISLQDQNIINGQLFDDIGLRKIGQQKDSIDYIRNFFINIRPKIYEYLLYFLLIISFLSFMRAMYGFYLNPTFLFISLVFLYCSIFVWNIYVIWERKDSRLGRVLDSITMQPINGARMEIQNEKFESSASDTSGNIQFKNVGKRERVKFTNMPTYRIKDADDNGEIIVEFNQDGFLSSDIFLERIKPGNISRSPFS